MGIELGMENRRSQIGRERERERGGSLAMLISGFSENCVLICYTIIVFVFFLLLCVFLFPLTLLKINAKQKTKTENKNKNRKKQKRKKKQKQQFTSLESFAWKKKINK